MGDDICTGDTWGWGFKKKYNTGQGLKIEKELGAQNKMQLGNYKAVLLKSGHGGAMAERRGGFLKKRHQIAVAWRVSNGGTMAIMAENSVFFLFFSTVGVGLTRPNPTR